MYLIQYFYKARQFATAINNIARKFSMNIININEPSACEKAVKSLLQGSVIALPTDTVYGIAALSQNDSAVEKIYNVKKRNSAKPLAICVGDISDIFIWAKVTVPNSLLSCLLPGPVTLIFERTNALNPELNAETNLVGIRIPDSNFIRDVVKGCATPIALTSANISSKESPLSIEEFKELWNKLDYIFDGGPLGEESDSRQGSTIVDLSQKGVYSLVREGSAFKRTTDILHKYGLIRIA